MSIAIINNAEGGTSGTTATTGNSGGTSGTAFSAIGGTANTFKFDNTHVHTGTLSYKCAIPTIGNFSDPSFTVSTAAPAVYGRVYLYMTAYPASGSGTPIDIGGAFISVNTVGKISTSLSGATIVTSAFTLPLNTWVRLDVKTKLGTGTAQIVCQAFVGSAGAESYLGSVQSTANGTLASVTTVFIGEVGNACTVTWWIDDIAFSDTNWCGPVPASAGNQCLMFI